MDLLIEIGIGAIVVVPVTIVFALSVREAHIRIRQARQGREAMEQLRTIEKGDRRNGNGNGKVA